MKTLILSFLGLLVGISFAGGLVYGIKELYKGFMIGYFESTKIEIQLSSPDKVFLMRNFNNHEKIILFLKDRDVEFVSYRLVFNKNTKDVQLFIHEHIKNPYLL